MKEDNASIDLIHTNNNTELIYVAIFLAKNCLNSFSDGDDKIEDL